jgi:hypothetical protein
MEREFDNWHTDEDENGRLFGILYIVDSRSVYCHERLHTLLYQCYGRALIRAHSASNSATRATYSL